MRRWPSSTAGIPASCAVITLLRHAAQLARTERVPAGSSAHLVQLPPAAKPEEPTQGLGLVRGSDRVLALASTSDHPSLDTKRGPMRVTSGKSRVRESRLPGSVRAKPNGRATRPRPNDCRNSNDNDIS